MWVAVFSAELSPGIIGTWAAAMGAVRKPATESEKKTRSRLLLMILHSCHKWLKKYIMMAEE